MADFKFSCPQCGQHISGNEQWAGHQIRCPACATTITVPQAPLPPGAVAAVPQSLVPQPPVSHGTKLSAGATQVARSPAPGPTPRRQLAARPPRNNSPLLKYIGYAVVLTVLGMAGYIFVPSLVSNIKDKANSQPTQTGSASKSGGAGPLGEVNEAMDVSETLDGGSSSSAPRPAAARPAAAAQTPTAPAANPATRSTNKVARAKSKQPGGTNSASGVPR
jgi:hypothetical protein